MLICEYCNRPTSGRLGDIAICASCFAARVRLIKKKNIAFANLYQRQISLMKAMRRGGEYYNQLADLERLVEEAEREYKAACAACRAVEVKAPIPTFTNILRRPA